MICTHMINRVNETMERHSKHFQSYAKGMERYEQAAFEQHPGAAEKMHECYLDAARHGEKLVKELRGIFLECYGVMETMGINKGRPYTTIITEEYPNIDIDGRMVRVVFDPMLPGRLKGSAHYIHEKLDIGIAKALSELGNPRIRFPRAAVIFIHKSSHGAVHTRFVKDYDNVERACVVNTLVKYFLDDDNGRQMFSMDITVEADKDCTVVYIMEPSAFIDFVTGLDLSLYGEAPRDVVDGHS